MDLYEVMRTTHAVREFTDEPLPDDTLYRILDNARFAPSGGNRQGTHITVVRDAQTRRRLAELGVPGARRYIAQLIAGENPWNPVHPSSVASEIVDTTDPPDIFIDSFIQAPVVLVVSVDLEVVAAFDQNLDRIGLVSGASVYPLVWNILLAARNEGYGGNLTSMAVPREAQVRELLGLPDTHALATVVPLGKPTRQLTKLRRRSVEETVTREHFDGAPFTRTANPRKFLGGLRRAWVPLVVVVAVVIGGLAIYHLHGMFGSRQNTFAGGGSSERILSTNPKHVAYEVFGPPGTSGMISYLDEHAQPREARFATLPWSVALTTTLSSVIADIMVQGNSQSLGCRIIVDGDVRDEQVSDAYSASTFCLVKAA